MTLCSHDRKYNVLNLMKPRSQVRPLMSQMAQFYAYGFSEIIEGEFSTDGVFPAIRNVKKILTDPARLPFVLRVKTDPVGFAIVHQLIDVADDREQFFVMFLSSENFDEQGSAAKLPKCCFKNFKVTVRLDRTLKTAARRSFGTG
jgi:predicted acetyltransferase